MSRVDNSLGRVGAFDDQHFDGDRLAARTLYEWSAALFVKPPCFVQGGLAFRIGFGMFAYAGYGYKLHACVEPSRNLYGVIERATSACRAVPGDQDVRKHRVTSFLRANSTHNDVSGAQYEIRRTKRLRGIQTRVNVGDDLGFA